MVRFETSLGAFTLVYGLLAAVDLYLLFKYSRRSPEIGTGPAAPAPPTRGAA